MNTEIKPARQRVTPSFAKWEAPAKFLRQSPPEHRNIPFVEDKDYLKMEQMIALREMFAYGQDYIKADKFDRAVAWALGFGAAVIIGVTVWEWLR